MQNFFTKIFFTTIFFTTIFLQQFFITILFYTKNKDLTAILKIAKNRNPGKQSENKYYYS